MVDTSDAGTGSGGTFFIDTCRATTYGDPDCPSEEDAVGAGMTVRASLVLIASLVAALMLI